MACATLKAGFCLAESGPSPLLGEESKKEEWHGDLVGTGAIP